MFDKLLAEKLLFLAVNPLAFPLANSPNPYLRKCVINNKTVVLYDVRDNQVNILSLFDGRQNPEKLKEKLK